MSDPFAAILPRRRTLSEETIIEEVADGRLDRALARLNSRRASNSLRQAVIEFWASKAEVPEGNLDSFKLNPFSKNFIADSNTGVIHRADSDPGPGLITSARPACGKKGEVFNCVVVGRFAEPNYHQSRCPDCASEENILLATEEDSWRQGFEEIIRAELDRLICDRLLAGRALSGPEVRQTAENNTARLLWTEEALCDGRNIIEGLLGEDDYNYFSRQLGRPAEEALDKGDWSSLYAHRSPIQLRQTLLHLLIAKASDA